MKTKLFVLGFGLLLIVSGMLGAVGGEALGEDDSIITTFDEVEAEANSSLGKSEESWFGVVPVYGEVDHDVYNYARAKVSSPEGDTYYVDMTWNGSSERFEGLIYIGSWHGDGLADPDVGVYDVTAQFTDVSDFSEIKEEDDAGTFETYEVRRKSSYSPSNPFLNSYLTSPNPVKKDDHWDYTISNFTVYSPTTLSDCVVTIPFYPRTAAVNEISVDVDREPIPKGNPKDSGDLWWWSQDAHTLYVQFGSIDDTEVPVDINFESDTDLWATRFDRVQTEDMGGRSFYNGLFISNEHLTTSIYGAGHENAGTQSESRAKRPGEKDVSTDCMERVAVHVDDEVREDDSGSYVTSIKWKGDFKDWIVEADNDKIVIQTESSESRWQQQIDTGISAKRTQTIYSGRRHIENYYEFENQGDAVHDYPLVWTREQWLGSDRGTDDRGRYHGDNEPVDIDTRNVMTGYNHSWLVSYDVSDPAGAGIIFDEEGVGNNTHGFFLESVPITPNGADWPIPVEDRDTKQAESMGFEQRFESIEPGESVDFRFWHTHYSEAASGDTDWETLEQELESDWEWANDNEVVEYDLTVNVEGEGSTDPAEGTHSYEAGTEVTLEALSDEGWRFDEWIIEGEDPVSYGFWPYWVDPDQYDPDWDELSHVSVFSMKAQANGSLHEDNMGHYDGVKAAAEETGTNVTLTVSQFDNDVQDEILADHKQDLVDNIVEALQDYDADGVNIDMEFVRDTNSITGGSNVGLMEELIELLYEDVKAVDEDYHVSFCTSGSVRDVYRNSNLSGYVDNVFLMGYDYRWDDSSTTGPVSPYNSTEYFDVTDSIDILRYHYPDEKLVLGVPFYGYEWPAESGDAGASTEGSGDSVIMKDAVENADQYDRKWDENGSVPWYAYEEDGQWYQGWYDDNQSLELKWEYVREEGLAGTGFWALGYEAPETWEVLGDVFSGSSIEEETITIAMDRNKSITARFETLNYSLNTSVEGSGTVDVEPEQERYEYGTDLTVEAIADENWEFVEWTGDATGTDPKINVTMDENKSITAVFEELGSEFEVTDFNVDPTGGEVPLEVDITAGIENVGGAEGTITLETDDVELESWTLAPGDTATVDETYTYEEDGLYHVELGNESISVEVGEVLTYTLELTTDGEGTVDVSPDRAEYEEGTEVRLTADPGEWWKFIEWTGDVENMEDPGSSETAIQMLGNYSITAEFEEEVSSYALTMDIEGGGTTEPAEGTHTYKPGSDVTVEAIPDEGWYFKEWTGDIESAGRGITVTMNANKSITAHFEEVEEGESILTIEVEGEGTTQPEPGDHLYDEGTEVRLTADPDEGWEFIKWNGDVEQIEDPGSSETTIEIFGNYSITAVFEEVEEVVEYGLTINIEGEGTTEPSEGTYTYEEDSEVTVEATPGVGWEFIEWTGDHEGEVEAITVVMDENKTITAHFEELDPAHFEIEIIDHDEEVNKSEEITIRFKVTNTGGLEGTQDVRLYLEGEEVENDTDIKLEPGGEYEGEFTWEAEKVGEQEFELRLGETSKTIDVDVVGDDDGSNGDDDDDGSFVSNYWWLILVLLISIIAAVVLISMMKGGEEEEEEDNNMDRSFEDSSPPASEDRS